MRNAEKDKELIYSAILYHSIGLKHLSLTRFVCASFNSPAAICTIKAAI